MLYVSYSPQAIRTIRTISIIKPKAPTTKEGAFTYLPVMSKNSAQLKIDN